jgi:RNA polymerase sigma-70 factor (ECF subfamily)
VSNQTNTSTDALATVAFNRVMAEHANALKAFASRMLSDEVQAEDIAQDAFLAYYRNLHKVPENAIRPWLFRVTRNLCLDQLRRRKFKLRLFRDVQRDDEFELTPVDLKSNRPDEHAQTEEVREAIEKAIQDLPARFREAFALCEVQGLSYEEAAGIMGCPVKTVSTRLFRARQRFRASLGNIIKV